MNNTPRKHPPSSCLDAFAVGHRDDATQAHVETCASCAEYVDGISHGAAAFAVDEVKIAKLVRDVRVREAGARNVRRTVWYKSRPGLGAALVLAAGLLVLIHQGRRDTRDEPTQAAIVEGSGGARFKGGRIGAQVAVIVDHAGSQSRQTGLVELVPGDRIRLEIALDHDGLVAAGVLTDSGDWAPLHGSALMTAGTHYSEQSIEFEHDVPRGVIIVGPADGVDAARTHRNFDNVVAIPLGPKGR
jgi:hypothetical protein